MTFLPWRASSKTGVVWKDKLAETWFFVGKELLATSRLATYAMCGFFERIRMCRIFFFSFLILVSSSLRIDLYYTRYLLLIFSQYYYIVEIFFRWRLILYVSNLYRSISSIKIDDLRDYIQFELFKIYRTRDFAYRYKYKLKTNFIIFFVFY